jgi:phosphate starvation-inducible protein PhoH
VRHPLVGRIVEAYEAAEERLEGTGRDRPAVEIARRRRSG